MKTPAIVRFGIALSASWRNRTALLGTFWKPLGDVLGPSWGSVGTLLAALEALRGHLGGYPSKQGGLNYTSPPSGPSNEP